MGEGVLGELLGSEAEEAHEADPLLIPLDPAAAAAAMDAARGNAALAESAALYFTRQTALVDKQSRLVDIQTEHLHEQREVNLANLKLRGHSERLKVAMQLFVALIATAIGAGLLVMVYDALQSRSVVVEAFDVSPAFASHGPTGRLLASSFLDELTKLQLATRSMTAKRSLSSAWANEIKIELPETGLSLGEINHLLKARLGHDLHIDGDLEQTDKGGLVLTVRGDDIPPKTFRGQAEELDRLTVQAAEYVYARSQPALFASFLNNSGRYEEVVTFVKSAYTSAAESERPYLLNTWGTALQNVGGDIKASLSLFEAALRLKPDYWIAYNNVMNSRVMLEDEAGAARTGDEMVKAAGGRPGTAPELMYQNLDLLRGNLAEWRAATVADLATNGGIGNGVTAGGPALADIDVRLHDLKDIELELQTAQGDSADPTIQAMAHFVRGRLATYAGDKSAALAEMDAFAAAYANPIVRSNYPGYNCWVAPAQEAAGQHEMADASLRTGGKLVDCYRFKGDILDGRGDWAGAQQAYQDAVALAPDLPAGYYSWGLALARHGVPADAKAKFQAANQHGPHWADPLKAWADVLAGEGQWKEALVKYDAALKYAPAWVELHQARDAAAAH